MATRGSYVHNSMVDFSGASRKCFMQFSLKNYGFIQKIHRAFRTHATLYEKALEKIVIFTIYQNDTLALNTSPKVVTVGDLPF